MINYHLHNLPFVFQTSGEVSFIPFFGKKLRKYSEVKGGMRSPNDREKKKDRLPKLKFFFSVSNHNNYIRYLGWYYH